MPRSGTVADARRPHGTDERVAVADYMGSLCTFKSALQLLAGQGATRGGGAGARGGLLPAAQAGAAAPAAAAVV